MWEKASRSSHTKLFLNKLVSFLLFRQRKTLRTCYRFGGMPSEALASLCSTLAKRVINRRNFLESSQHSYGNLRYSSIVMNNCTPKLGRTLSDCDWFWSSRFKLFFSRMCWRRIDEDATLSHQENKFKFKVTKCPLKGRLVSELSIVCKQSLLHAYLRKILQNKATASVQKNSW